MTYMSVGDDIVVTKWIGLEGSVRLAKNLRRGEDTGQLPDSILTMAEAFSEFLDVGTETGIAKDHGAILIREAGESGIFGALWDIGEELGSGLSVELHRLPIRQETIEICEIANENPYTLSSRGALVIVTAHGNYLADRLREAGVPATAIGYLTEEAGRIVKNGDRKRYLEPHRDSENTIKTDGGTR